MDDVGRVRKRIKNRRFDGTGEEKKHPIILFRIFYHAVMVMMGICVVVLALLLNQKLNLVQMPAVIQQFHMENLESWFPFENWFSLTDAPVSATNPYTLLKDNQYSNGTNQATSGYAGIVLEIKKEADGKSSIRIRQDNGVEVTYGHLNEVVLKQEERVVKGAVMGTVDSYVTISAVKDEKSIQVSDAFS